MIWGSLISGNHHTNIIHVVYRQSCISPEHRCRFHGTILVFPETSWKSGQSHCLSVDIWPYFTRSMNTQLEISMHSGIVIQHLSSSSKHRYGISIISSSFPGNHRSKLPGWVPSVTCTRPSRPIRNDPP